MSIYNRSASSEHVLAIFRVIAGLIFMSAGTMKLFGYPASPVPLPPFDPMTQLGIGALLEAFGGLAIVLGLFTRPVAFVLAGEMAVAYFQFHFPQSVFPTVNNGVPAVLYCFLFLYLTFAGAGTWSVDALMRRRRIQTRANVSAAERPAAASQPQQQRAA